MVPRRLVVAVAILFLAAHLPFLPTSLEDVDSVNFALGVRDFDVTRHQPHPPGYPVFIALGKTSVAALRAAGVASPDARGLALWSALAGAALVPLLFLLFRAVGGDERRAALAGIVAGFAPISWFTALRPLSDMAGLACAVGAQALLCSVIARSAVESGSPSGAGTQGPRYPGRPGAHVVRPSGASVFINDGVSSGSAPVSPLLGGAFLAGLAIGIRSQTFLLTLPLLALVLAWPATGLRLRDRLLALAAVVIAVLAWGVPLVVASGGMDSYLAALGAQGAEDFSGIVMLWNVRSPRVLLDAVQNSFLWPWGHPAIGAATVAVALLGLLRLAWRSPRIVVVLATAFLPYAVFHLLFHEVTTVRYALPLVVPLAFLVLVAVDGLPRRLAPIAVAILAVGFLVLSVPASATYAGRDSPPVAALLEADRRAPAGDRAAVIAMHAVTRRTAEWLAPRMHHRVLKAPHGREWLTLVDQWRSNPSSEVWFVADPRRTDLALFDPASRPPEPTRFRWGFTEPPFVGGARPGDSDLYGLKPPGWMLERGWSVTAEIAGITARDTIGPHKSPSVAWIRARQQDAVLMIGGRHLGSVNDPPVQVSLTLGGVPLAAFNAPPGLFIEIVPVAGGRLAGAGYLPLEVSARAADGNGREIAVSLEQFDCQSGATPMIGLGEGWHEPEFDPRTARSWRWASERANMWVRPVGTDVTLTIDGESPMRYFDAAPTVRLLAGATEIARFSPSSDFTKQIVLSASVLAAADGRVTLETDKWFVPGERDGGADRRHLALRIYSWSVR